MCVLIHGSIAFWQCDIYSNKWEENITIWMRWQIMIMLISLITPTGETLSSSIHPFFCLFSPFIHSSHVLPLSPLHADPGGVEDAHQSQYPLQDVSDDIRGHAEGSDLRQSFGLDVSNCTLCFIHQRLEGSNDKKIDMYRGKEVFSTVDMASIKTVEASSMYVCQFYVYMYAFLCRWLVSQVKQTHYLDFLQLIIYFGLSLFNLGDFLSHLSFNLLHFCLLVTGILDIPKDQMMFILADWVYNLKMFYIFFITT